MSVQAFFPGDYVTPKRTFLKKDTGGFGHDVDAFVDAAGRRTTFGQVVDVSEAPVPSTVETWDYKTSSMRPVYPSGPTVTAFVYAVRVWDIDARSISIVDYPETELLPGPTFGPSSANHVFLGALPSDVAEMAAGLAASGDDAATRVLAASATVPQAL